MSAVKPVLSPLTRCALETEVHVAADGWGQQPRLFALARNGRLLAAQPELRAVLGDVDPEEFSAIEQEDAVPDGDLEKALGHLGWSPDVDGVALAVERIVVPPQDTPTQQGEREDVRFVVGVLRDGEIITLVRRKAEDSEDKVAIGTNVAPGLVEALKATFA